MAISEYTRVREGVKEVPERTSFEDEVVFVAGTFLNLLTLSNPRQSRAFGFNSMPFHGCGESAEHPV